MTSIKAVENNATCLKCLIKEYESVISSLDISLDGFADFVKLLGPKAALTHKHVAKKTNLSSI